MNTQKLLEIVSKVIKQAGNEVLNFYHQDYKITKKKDKSPVTQADLISDQIIFDGLKQFNWPVLSEESKDDLSRLNSEKLWIVDSLDGTMDFIQKTDEFSIMICLVENYKPILSVIYAPVLDKLYFAVKNYGAFLHIGENKTKLKVSSIKDLKKARLVVSRNHLGPHDEAIAKKMQVKELRKTGSNGIKIGLIAEGKADIFFNLTDKMGEWDSAATEIILKEAGGQISDIDGNDLIYNKKIPKQHNGIVASNKLLHNKIIKNLDYDRTTR